MLLSLYRQVAVELVRSDAAAELVGTGTKVDRARARIGTDAAAVRLRSGQELVTYKLWGTSKLLESIFSLLKAEKGDCKSFYPVRKVSN